jgi:hypothetical protein
MHQLALAVALGVVACRGSASPPPVVAGRPAPAPAHRDPAQPQPQEVEAVPPVVQLDGVPPPWPPLEVALPHAITWSRVAGGELWTYVGPSNRDTLTAARVPILAHAVHGQMLAAITKGETMQLLIVRAVPDAQVTTVPLPLPIVDWREHAAMAMTDRVAHVAIAAPDGSLFTATVDLATAKLTRSATLVLGFRRVPLSPLLRARDRWVFAAPRGDAPGGPPDELVAWTLRDGDARAVAGVGLGAKLGSLVDGAAASDGSLVVLTRVGGRDPASSEPDGGTAAVMRRGAWTRVALPATVYVRPVATDEHWLVPCLHCSDAPHVYTSAGVGTGNGIGELDATWAGVGRQGSQALVADRSIYVFGGSLMPRSAQGQSAGYPEDRLDGAIYDPSRRTVRTFPAPVLDQLPDLGWRPNVAVPIGDRLCLLGGSASAASPARSGKLHAAACLDPATLTWQWYASQVDLGLPPQYTNGAGTLIGTRCETVGPVDRSTTAVWCAERTHAHAGDGRTSVGPYRWGLWLAHLDD